MQAGGSIAQPQAGAAGEQMPMDQSGQMPGGDTGMEGGIDNMPEMGGGEEMSPMDDQQMDPSMEGMPEEVPDMGDDTEGMSKEDGGDSTEAIISQLSPEQKEAVRSYAMSMLDNSEDESNAEEMPEEMPQEPPVQMESIILSKKQLRELNERLRDTDKIQNSESQKKEHKNKRSPFNSPKFK